jgi:hypothetical protein
MPLLYVPTKDDPMSGLQRQRQLLEQLCEKYNVVIQTKESSWLMRLIGRVLFFNKSFMSTYITTIGNTIYFPETLLNHDESFCSVIPHELVHAQDMGSKWWMSILYLFPQILFLFSFFSIFAVFNTWNLLWLVCIIFLLPLPAYWRKNFEMRGNALSMAVLEWTYGISDQAYLTIPPPYICRAFTGADYYYMWPFKQKVTDELQTWIFRIQTDQLGKYILIADEIKPIFKDK